MNRKETKRLPTATLMAQKGVIPAKAGTQKNTGFRVKPGMTSCRRFMLPCMKRASYLSLALLLVFAMAGCAAPKEELHAHGDIAPVKSFPKGYVHPLTEINFEKVADENRGLKILEENATKVHDYYRGGVQEKAEGERALKEGKPEEAMAHFEKANRFFLVVTRYLSEDDAYRNIYGDHVVIFLPNLLMADSYLKMIAIFKKTGEDGKAAEAKGHGEYYLEKSLKSVKTEWAFRIKKEFEEVLPKK